MKRLLRYADVASLSCKWLLATILLFQMSASGQDLVQIPVQVTTPSRRSDFQMWMPDKNALRQLEDERGDSAIRLVRSERCTDCRGSRTFVFEVRNRMLAIPTEFIISNEAAQVDEVRVGPKGLAIIVGRQDNFYSLISLVEMKTGKVVREFFAFRPVISDDAGLIAFVKPFPTRSQTASFVYVVYDVAAMESGLIGNDFDRLTNMLNAGQILFPKGATQRDIHVANSVDAHYRGSRSFYWLGGERVLAFGDTWREQKSLVVADLRQGVKVPKMFVTPLLTERILFASECPTSYLYNAFEIVGVDAIAGESHAVLVSVEASSCRLQGSQFKVRLDEMR